MDEQEEDDLQLPDTPPRKKSRSVKTAQKFRNEWLCDTRFKYWLQKVPNDIYRAQCKLCLQPLTADVSVLIKHQKSSKHQAKENPLLNAPKITNFLKTHAETDSMSKLATATKNAEIKLVGCLAEHNISFNVLEHLTDTLKNMFLDSQICQNMNLKRTKGTAIAKNVIGGSEKAQLERKLKNTKFSILTDESTDISNCKSSCIVVRYYDEEQKRIVSKFWDLVQVFDADGSVESATAEHLYGLLIKSIEDRGIPKENIIGFGSDGCNVMMGENNSVASRLKRDFPGIFIMKCLCHSFHLVASEACKRLPRALEDLARNIYSFFHASSKRLSAFAQFQHFAETPIHAMLHPSQTRWLSLNAVVARMLEQWPALLLFFTEKKFVEQLVVADTILRSLQDPFNKLFFLFLKWVLPKFTRVNEYFQSAKVVITDVHGMIVELYTDLLCSYMKRSHVVSKKLSQINPTDASQFLLKTQMYLGVNVMTELQKPVFVGQKELLDHFFSRCQGFLIQACLEIKKRYDFENNIFGQLHVLKPTAALSHETRNSTPSLVPLISLLPRVNENDNLQFIDDEWRRLPSHKFEKDMTKLEIDVFWSELLNLKNDGGEYLFHSLARIVLYILSLPHANADCERVFSKTNLIKTKTRNKLIVPTISGLLLTSQNVQSSGGCPHFKPTDDMRSRMTSAILYGEKKKSQTISHVTPDEDVEDEEFYDDDVIFS